MYLIDKNDTEFEKPILVQFFVFPNVSLFFCLLESRMYAVNKIR